MQRTTVLIGVAFVALLAGIVYLLWGFWLGFIGLTLVYLTIGAVIAVLIARYYGREPMEYLRNNNTWFFVLLGATAITFVIAWFNFGPAVLLPENFPTPKQRGAVADFLSHLWRGKNAPAPEVPTDPLPWATGTWFWWKAGWLLLFFTIAYSFYAFSDEIGEAWRTTTELFRRRREEHDAMRRRQAHAPAPQQQGQRGRGQQQGQQAAPAVEHLGTWDFVRLQFIVEMVVEFLSTLWRQRRRNA